jgi:hypothetical protein
LSGSNFVAGWDTDEGIIADYNVIYDLRDVTQVNFG